MLRGGSLLSVAAQNTGTDYETVEIERGNPVVTVNAAGSISARQRDQSRLW